MSVNAVRAISQLFQRLEHQADCGEGSVWFSGRLLHPSRKIDAQHARYVPGARLKSIGNQHRFMQRLAEGQPVSKRPMQGRWSSYLSHDLPRAMNTWHGWQDMSSAADANRFRFTLLGENR